MTTEELEERFEELTESSDEFLAFNRIEKKRSNRPDLHAFLLLDELVPGDRDIISCAAHDQFYIGIGMAELAAVITEEQIVELIRCGVLVYEESLSMFA